MTNFIKINDLPCYDLLTEINNLQVKKSLKWSGNQICINTSKDNLDDYHLGTGSLLYDWDKSYTEIDVNGIEKIITPVRDIPLKEEQFCVVANVFKNTLFEEVYIALTKKYNIGRVRLMKSKPKTTLTWHIDETKRIHYPIKTQEGCFMVIEEEIKHLTANNWWWTNTIIPHTAFNASKEDRIHLVAVLLE